MNKKKRKLHPLECPSLDEDIRFLKRDQKKKKRKRKRYKNAFQGSLSGVPTNQTQSKLHTNAVEFLEFFFFF